MTTRQEEQAPRYAIIVAGGKGLRMQTDLPKQFLPLRGRPVLMHTMECFRGLVDKVVLVLPSEQVHYWAGLCEEQDFDLPHTMPSVVRHALPPCVMDLLSYLPRV